MSAIFSLCVFCGSRAGERSAFGAAAREVGQWLGQQGGQLVYGGGRAGLMGTVAQATREAGGRVVGIIPKTLVDKEMADTDCDELHVVETMHERKAMMGERADAFLALPGGIGTLEELFEVWTWRQLGYHDKPVGILNSAGYYDGLLDFLAQSVREGFMGQWQMGLVKTGASAPALLATLRDEARRHPDGDQLAQVL